MVKENRNPGFQILSFYVVKYTKSGSKFFIHSPKSKSNEL